MQLRAFGSTDLKVSEFGLGCARIGGVFQGDSREFLRLFAVAADFGINFFDTADMYAQGESEVLLGRAFRNQRGRVIIASKAGYALPKRRRFVSHVKPFVRPLIKLLKLKREQVSSGAKGVVTQDFSPAYLRQAVEGSLRRLRTDYLDLFQLHSVPLEVVQRGDWQPVLEELKRAGKIRYYGLSVDALAAGVAGLTHEGVSSIQCVLSLIEPGSAAELIPKARDRGVGIIAREVLGNGLLIKEPHEYDLHRYCSTPEQVPEREKQLAELRQKVAESGLSLPSFALKYVSSLEGVSVSLLGARTVPQLRKLLDYRPS